jgi:cytochrome c peroxidase
MGRMKRCLRNRTVLVVAVAVALAGCGRNATTQTDESTEEPQKSYATADRPFEPLPDSVPHNKAAAALGEKLYGDKILSDDGKIACIDCHDIEKYGGADGRTVAIVEGRDRGNIHVTSILNLAFSYKLGWTGKFSHMEKQLEAPMTKRLVMNSKWENISRRLEDQRNYRLAFKDVYDDGVTETNIRNALSEYQRSLVTPNSKFDQFLRSEGHAGLSDDEEEGYRRFKALGCVSCHQGIGIGGNMLQRFGVMLPYPELDPSEVRREFDKGRMAWTGEPDDDGVFRVPSLRNVAVTAPYFHDGETFALEDAVEIMARHQLARDDIDKATVCYITAFLGALTGEFEGELLEQKAPLPGGGEEKRQKAMAEWGCAKFLTEAKASKKAPKETSPTKRSSAKDGAP